MLSKRQISKNYWSGPGLREDGVLLSRETRKGQSLHGSDINGRAGCSRKSTGWEIGVLSGGSCGESDRRVQAVSWCPLLPVRIHPQHSPR